MELLHCILASIVLLTATKVTVERFKSASPSLQRYLLICLINESIHFRIEGTMMWYQYSKVYKHMLIRVSDREQLACEFCYNHKTLYIATIDHHNQKKILIHIVVVFMFSLDIYDLRATQKLNNVSTRMKWIFYKAARPRKKNVKIIYLKTYLKLISYLVDICYLLDL